MDKNGKKKILKEMVKNCKDGKGGPGFKVPKGLGSVSKASSVKIPSIKTTGSNKASYGTTGSGKISSPKISASALGSGLSSVPGAKAATQKFSSGSLAGQKSLGLSTRANLSPEDYAALAPYKNAFYRRAKAAQAFGRIAKLTGLGTGAD